MHDKRHGTDPYRGRSPIQTYVYEQMYYLGDADLVDATKNSDYSPIMILNTYNKTQILSSKVTGRGSVLYRFLWFLKEHK